MEKLIAYVFLAFIVWNLFAAMYHMISKPQADGRMVRSLAWRIGASIALIAILGAGHYFGWWQFRDFQGG